MTYVPCREARRWQFQCHSLKKRGSQSFHSLKYVFPTCFFLFIHQVVFPQWLAPCPPTGWLNAWPVLCSSLSSPWQPSFFLTVILSSWEAVRPLELTGHWLISVLSTSLLPVQFVTTMSCALLCHNQTLGLDPLRLVSCSTLSPCQGPYPVPMGSSLFSISSHLGDSHITIQRPWFFCQAQPRIVTTMVVHFTYVDLSVKLICQGLRRKFH